MPRSPRLFQCKFQERAAGRITLLPLMMSLSKIMLTTSIWPFGSFIGSGEGKEENIANDDDCTIEVPCGLLLAMQSNEKKVVDDALGLGFDNGWNSSNGGGFLDDDGLAWNRSSDFGLGL